MNEKSTEAFAPLLFVDLETTGLNPERHEAWEIGWAFDDEPVESLFLLHGGYDRDPQADEVNNYPARCPAWASERHRYMANDKSGAQEDILAAEYGREAALARRVSDTRPYIVSSAPSAVDIPFLTRRWATTGGDLPWHHRAIDISSLAMLTLRHERPMGLFRVATDLRKLGYDVRLPDHTAAADVESLRDCYYALQALDGPPWVLPGVAQEG